MTETTCPPPTATTRETLELRLRELAPEALAGETAAVDELAAVNEQLSQLAAREELERLAAEERAERDGRAAEEAAEAQRQAWAAEKTTADAAREGALANVERSIAT